VVLKVSRLRFEEYVTGGQSGLFKLFIKINSVPSISHHGPSGAMVARQTSNLEVVGSSPTRDATALLFAFFFFYSFITVDRVAF
jgi:hypothetical protein